MEIKKRPDKFWKKLLAVTLRQNTFFGSRRKYYFDSAEITRREVELINISKIDDRLKPIEILLKYFCHTVEDAKRLRRNPTRVRKMIGWKAENGNVDELMQDVIYTMEKDRSLFEAQTKRYYQSNRHPRAMLSTSL
ncbi:unnamed protein product [Bursaphelenchus xylophilus]|uniref:(pine wood nematode) hypothetical protein n=1 Tax=Bursaphelenchus xylophilus TaxID=6326 RepID=A0A1I7RHX1_BURXY|nr:unnamed protein product [Bursaphelenchus xylophilus]CAG9115311.1 unnamed protein product [Bursaphelenchus xylophilus]